MTRRELQTRVLRALDDDTTTPVYWTLAEVQDSLQEAQEVLAEEAPLIKRTFTLPRRPGTTIYSLSGIGGNIMAPYRVWAQDLHRRLEAKTLADFDNAHELWWTVTGEPQYWAPITWDQFAIWPAPTTGAGVLQVDCYCWPSAMADDGDSPEFHPSQHEALAVYGEGLGHLKAWNAEGVVKSWAAFFTRVGSVRSQANIRQVQERFWTRETRR